MQSQDEDKRTHMQEPPVYRTSQGAVRTPTLALGDARTPTLAPGTNTT